VVNRDGGQTGRWSIGTVVNRDGGQYYCGQSQCGQLQRDQSGLWSILTWPNGTLPPENVTYNMHNLIYLAVDAKRLGPLDSFSAFLFENYRFILKKFLRKFDKPLQQICNRLDPARNDLSNRCLIDVEIIDIISYRNIA